MKKYLLMLFFSFTLTIVNAATPAEREKNETLLINKKIGQYIDSNPQLKAAIQRSKDLGDAWEAQQAEEERRNPPPPPPPKVPNPILDPLKKAQSVLEQNIDRTSASLHDLCDVSKNTVDNQRKLTAAVNDLQQTTGDFIAAAARQGNSHRATTVPPTENQQEQSLTQNLTASLASDLSDAYYYVSRIGGGLIMVWLIKKCMDSYVLKKNLPEKSRFIASTDSFKKRTL